MVRLMLLFDITDKRSVLIDLDGVFTTLDQQFTGSSIDLTFYNSLERIFEKNTDPDSEEVVEGKNGGSFKALVLYKSSDPISMYQRFHADTEEQKLDHES